MRLTVAQAKKLGIGGTGSHKVTVISSRTNNVKTLSVQSNDHDRKSKATVTSFSRRGRGKRKVEPQTVLSDYCDKRFNQEGQRCHFEFKGSVPGRRFSLDLAFPHEKLAIEVDGWQYHGKFLADFKRDRERQNLLTLNGWRILRFTASDIYKEHERVLEQIEEALNIGKENIL